VPEAAARNGTTGEAIQPRDLRALVQDMTQWRQTPVANTSMIAISLSSALPEAKRTDKLVEALVTAMSKLGAKVRARFYRATPGDFVFMVKADEGAMVAIVRDLKIDLLRQIESQFPGSFGTIDQSRLVVCYDLLHNYRSAADRVTRFAQAHNQQQVENDGKLRALTGNDIERVMAAYKKFGTERFIKAFVRCQDAMIRPQGQPMKKLMTEYFISMDLLRKPLFIDVEMRGSGRLFNEFTLMLDQIMLEAFPQVAVPGMECSMNLNVQSVFTPVFEEFISRSPPENIKHVVFEFRQANIVEHFDEYQVARGLIKEKGARIAVDQIFPQTVGLVDIDYLGASVAKIHWRAGSDEVFDQRRRALKYMADCGVQPILIRVDDPHALEVGATMGIDAYQGFLIDSQVREEQGIPPESAAASEAPPS
jgi:EAL domain-containing protein (putative c-di-GMP-specific phosphodiesterase class I)